MTDDLDTLRPEVREALDEMDRIARIIPAQCSDELRIIHAELLRFGRENDEWQTRCLQFQTERDMARAELTLAHRERDRMFLDAREWATRFGEMEARAEKAEAELAALKARIAGAARAYHSSFEFTLDASTLYARATGVPGEETYALVKMEDDDV